MAHTKYIWDPLSDNVLMEKDGNGATTAVNTYLPEQYGDQISQRRDGETSYYHFDGQGSTRALTDESKNVTDTYTYTATGEEVNKVGTTENPYRYVGEKGYYFDKETGDYYVRARVYEPTIVRWLSADPAGFVDGMNHYVYGLNDLVNLADASGMQTSPIRPWGLNGGGAGKRCCVVKWETITFPGLHHGECYFNRSAVKFGFEFSFVAQFGDDCRCCEYRQYVSDDVAFSLVNKRTRKTLRRYRFGHGRELVEDSSAFEGEIIRYGHRSSEQRLEIVPFRLPVLTDAYLPRRVDGCLYQNYDWPGIPGVNALRYMKAELGDPPRPKFGLYEYRFELHYRFLLNVIDVCDGGHVVTSRVLDRYCSTTQNLDGVYHHVWK